MTDHSKAALSSSPHVVVAYQDDDDEAAEQQQSSALLPRSSVDQPRTQSRARHCCKRLILALSLLTICIGIFETLFHGKEAESLRAAKAKIGQLEHELSHHFKGGFDRVMATISPSNGVQSGAAIDAEIERVMSKSVIVLKTGASVLFDRLPVQLLLAQSALQPLQSSQSGQSGYNSPPLLVYSDAAMQLGSYTVHNALANVSTFVRSDPQFSRQYRDLHALLDSGEDLSASKFEKGWDLDKWKFLYMWQDAFQRHPDADWYIGYEADTYVLWRSLFRFLSQQDPHKEQLFGCGSILVRNHELFANGGCPYLISGALMRATYGNVANFASKFDTEVQKSCCGDAELSIALRRSATVPIKQLGDSGARFQNRRPREVLFEPDNWCQPIVNFHHLKAYEVADLARIESEIRSSKPARETVFYSDVFDHLVPPNLKTALDALAHNKTESIDLHPRSQRWEAFGRSEKNVGRGKRAPDAVGCQQQCMESDGCTTWLWGQKKAQSTDGDCYLMHDAVRIGEAFQGAEQLTSGWIAERVHEFKAQHHCDDPPTA